MTAQNVVDMLEARGVIDSGQAYDLTQDVVQNGKDILQALLDYEIFPNEDVFWSLVAEELGAEHFDLASFEPAPSVVNLIPGGMARLYGAFPVTLDGRGLHVAFTDPLNPQLVEDLRFGLDKIIVPVVARRSQVQDLIDKHYGTSAPNIDEIFGGLKDAGKNAPEVEANSAPIVKFVDLVMTQAIKERASDIHFEPFEHEFKIRYRVDGALYEMAPPPVHLATSVISRIKVMSNMNIAERRIPQDGRIMTVVNGKAVDMRVSSLPTQHGESVVLRVLDRSSIQLELTDLGMPGPLRDYIEDTIEKPNGIFIVTGPTGAGKTTTLYACLRKINTVDSKLLTAEDPVEYELDGIMQVPVNDAVGLTFARALRAFLRQDPDRIMVGEMRDKETAQIAIQASLTGHLVLSTLHTNDAAGAVTRLVDMGVEPFLVASSVRAFIAQRLVRVLCSDCKEIEPDAQAKLHELKYHGPVGAPVYRAREGGCEACRATGYKGRMSIYELVRLTPAMGELITHKASGQQLLQQALKDGYRPMREYGVRKILAGLTTIEEVISVTVAESEQ